MAKHGGRSARNRQASTSASLYDPDDPASANLEVKEQYASLYFERLKPHDEFGYVKRKDFKIDFDSKLNFDGNYESSWFYYYHWRRHNQALHFTSPNAPEVRAIARPRIRGIQRSNSED